MVSEEWSSSFKELMCLEKPTEQVGASHGQQSMASWHHGISWHLMASVSWQFHDEDVKRICKLFGCLLFTEASGYPQLGLSQCCQRLAAM